MADDPGLTKRIRAQTRESRRDLPTRWAFVTLVAILSGWFLPLWQVLAFYLASCGVELANRSVQHRLSSRVDRFAIIATLVLALAESTLLATLMGTLWAQDGVAPKVVAFTGFSTALLHATMARSTWICFGVASAAPLVAGLLITVVTYLFDSDEWADALAGTALLVTMVVYLSRSMTAMHSARSELIAAHGKAEEASRAKSRFLATASHEIRTPLNAIHGMSQLLRDDHDPKLIGERTNLLFKASTTLGSIVDDLLDHARVEAGRYRLKPEDVDLSDMLRSVVATFSWSAGEKGSELEIQVAPGAPTLARFDVLRAQQVVGNLISNAVKYSDGGRIEVRLDASATEDGWEIFIAVSDQGPGLTNEEIALVFQEFERIERSHGGGIMGTGLGLPIARGFARLMGGDIAAESVPGMGTTFTFRFPAGTAAGNPGPSQVEAAASTSVGQTGAQPVLVVDDNATNRYLLRSFLLTGGFEVVEAENGAEALAALEEQRFSVVLLDMNMPVLDGPSTVAEMRRIGGRVGATPVIALTADTAESAQARYRGLEIDGYIIRPVRRDDLLFQVAGILERQTSRAA